jgi:hypothetical protein
MNKALQIPTRILTVTATKGLSARATTLQEEEDFGRYAPILDFLAY